MKTLIDQLYSAEEIYRPPLERNSALLEVTQGCSYGKCFFCDFGRDTFFQFPLEEIRSKIQILGLVIGDNPRLFLTGCNPFCLQTDTLLQILHWIHHDLPLVNSVSMYARAEDINKKSKQELKLLAQMGITDLHVGLESGSAEVLHLHNKGETPEQIRQALDMLTNCGMYYHVTVIPGMGGRRLSDTHARHTADLLSCLQPLSIWCTALKIWPGTPLAHMAKNGQFQPLTPEEILREERTMLERIQLKNDCIYADSTVLNQYTIVTKLPDGKEASLQKMQILLER